MRKVVETVNLFDDIPKNAKVFIKPNIVYWNAATNFRKWGVITTSRVIEDVIVLLKERGIDDISIGEGIVTVDIKDTETAADAFEKLGYNTLKERYGIKIINTFENKFEKIDLDTGFKVNFCSDALAADVVIDIPVLKTHSQAVVTLGFKNLKGLINYASRKKFHSDDPVKDWKADVECDPLTKEYFDKWCKEVIETPYGDLLLCPSYLDPDKNAMVKLFEDIKSGKKKNMRFKWKA